ncbi:MAG: hypothetical protein WCH34_12365, partial [Bacteroidota bacterium]
KNKTSIRHLPEAIFKNKTLIRHLPEAIFKNKTPIRHLPDTILRKLFQYIKHIISNGLERKSYRNTYQK